MKTASQPTLPGVPDYSEPQIVSAQRLARTITEANGAGFEAVRLAVRSNFLSNLLITQQLQGFSTFRAFHMRQKVREKHIEKKSF